MAKGMPAYVYKMTRKDALEHVWPWHVINGIEQGINIDLFSDGIELIFLLVAGTVLF